MCCIIHRLIDSKDISKENLEKIIKKNPHGWGISYVDDEGNLQIEKSMEMDLAIDKIRQIEKENREFLFHARWATHGKKDEQNCHPFPIYKGCMFHNGKIEDIKMWRKDIMSDSWHFSFKVSKQLKKNKTLEHIVDNKFKKSVEKSRLAFMMKNGDVHKFGEWHEIDGNFYSKLDWKNTWIGNGVSYWENIEDFEEEFDRTRNRGFSEDNRWNNVREYLSNKKSNKKEKHLSHKEINDIEDSISQGIVLESFIEKLNVETLSVMNENYSLTMATFIYNQLHNDDDKEEIKPTGKELVLVAKH